MRVIIAIFLSAAALASCTPESNHDVTGSIETCARKLYSQYNPKDAKQCVAYRLRTRRGHHLLDSVQAQRRNLTSQAIRLPRTLKQQRV